MTQPIHPMLEKVARAIAEKMDVTMPHDIALIDNQRGRQGDIILAARAAIQTLMEPDEGMLEATQNTRLWRGTDWDGTEHFSEPSNDEAFQVLQAILKPLLGDERQPVPGVYNEEQHAAGFVAKEVGDELA